jgi:hypothetical protein
VRQDIQMMARRTGRLFSRAAPARIGNQSPFKLSAARLWNPAQTGCCAGGLEGNVPGN